MSATQALALRDWAQPVRAYGQSLLGDVSDPHAELLALVWGPRFDRQHAHALLDHQFPAQTGLLKTVMEAADRFDRLGGAQQQRVRQLILRHRAQTARC
ncbi:hypothetical protein [Rhodoferax sp.]|uniref:hypothetical protein n=1 Tax=Rhodoferax sp. TaxID=50421 RepID=UPI0027501772|nr:hypothetical protein [Rhodoferax sp.]